MKSLGKKEIIFETFDKVANKTLSQVVQSRTVYEKKDGTFWINWNQRKYQIETIDPFVWAKGQQPATFKHVWYVNMVKSLSLSQV